ncbi:MAG TPA: carboxymuconolactone decarboxylase family protein [Polyangiales bacterium]
MRLTKPRIEPLPLAQLPEEFRKYMSATPDAPVLNVYRTVARHAKLAKRWLVFGTHVLAKSTLPGRDRELLILRTGFRCGSEYEWGQHAAIALIEGISDQEIVAIGHGPEHPQWNAFDAALLRAADELHDDSFVSEPTWQALTTRYNEAQMLDLLFAVGQYTLVSMVLNSCGVQLEPGTPGWPAELRGKTHG